MTYELRTYTAHEGKLDALAARFRDHTVRLFEKHGMVSIGYWIPIDSTDTLVYVLQHHGDPKANWRAFQADDEWIAAKAASEVDGPLAANIVAVVMEPTDFSALA
ncbi:MAG TPA: NIPSNAP family protein [Galbitalea sp.]|jgi:hypothetical protein